MEIKYCACCNRTVTATFPAGVHAPVQYGEIIRSWSVYYQNQHFIPGLCNQHHLRELKSIMEHEKESWATAMTRLLRVSLRCRHFHGYNAIPAARIIRLTSIYDKIIKYGLAFHEAQTPLPCKGKQGRQPRRTGHNLLLRLIYG